MKRLVISLTSVLFLGLLIVLNSMGRESQAGKLSGTSEGMLASIERLLEINPNLAMNAGAKNWGKNQWCMHLSKKRTNMVHIAKDPSKDDADIILSVYAEPFIKDAGLQTEAFPQILPPYESGLVSGQWYYAPKDRLLLLPIRIEDVGKAGKIVAKIK
jgi:hypothetical protein